MRLSRASWRTDRTPPSLVSLFVGRLRALSSGPSTRWFQPLQLCIRHSAALLAFYMQHLGLRACFSSSLFLYFFSFISKPDLTHKRVPAQPAHKWNCFLGTGTFSQLPNPRGFQRWGSGRSRGPWNSHPLPCKTRSRFTHCCVSTQAPSMKRSSITC